MWNMKYLLWSASEREEGKLRFEKWRSVTNMKTGWLRRVKCVVVCSVAACVNEDGMHAQRTLPQDK